VRHFGFPDSLEHFTFRLYATERMSEALEIQWLRFRALTPEEQEGLEKHQEALDSIGPPQHYPILDETVPLGVFMKAGAAKALSEAMGISYRDYWRLMLEDIVRYHHNTVALEEIDALTEKEWRELLGLAVSFGVRILAVYNWPLGELENRCEELVNTHIAPHAKSEAILAWALHDEPPEGSFSTHIEARGHFERADSKHPLVFIMREPNSYGLFAPYFPASGISHFKSRSAWELGTMVDVHRPCNGGQQFWVSGPAFVYATDTPNWYSCPEMRLMLNLAFANGARGWFSFCYHNEPIWMGSPFKRSLTGPFLTFSDLWSELGTRMERFSAFVPLFLQTTPADEPLEEGIEIEYTPHPLSQLPEGLEPIQWRWHRGEDFALLYIVSNDTTQVTPVYITIPEQLSGDTAAYDVTDFVRSARGCAIKSCSACWTSTGATSA